MFLEDPEEVIVMKTTKFFQVCGKRAAKMRFFSGVCGVALGVLSIISPASAGVVTYVMPTEAGNSNANFSSASSSATYNQNFGYAFTTGTGTYDIDWVNVGLNTSGVTSGSGSIKIALHATNNSTAYSAVATSTAYATDIVNFTMPTTTSTAFQLSLTAAQLPNLSAFTMQANTTYALILYAPSVNIGMMRKTGFASGTTNNFYTVGSGFTMLTTFRNNSNYSSNPSSFPTIDLAFGSSSAGAVPEPTSGAMAVILFGGAAFRRLRRKSGTDNSIAN